MVKTRGIREGKMVSNQGGMPSSCGMLNKRETEAYKTTCSERIFTMTTQTNTNQQTKLENETTCL